MDKAQFVRAALERYEQPLLRYAARITGEAESARDVVQDTFLKLCTAERDGIEDHLAAWLYTVCRNRALTVRKKEARMGTLSEEAIGQFPDTGMGPEAVAEQNETQGRVLAALAALPDAQREACRLKFQDGLSYREISQVMGKSLGTVSNLITSALTAVREQLSTEGGLAQEVIR
jgi:RNA polymerase sigma-70 factor (ECF subfamily)